MTLILGLRCKDALLLVSDGQATANTSGQPTKLPTRKLYTAWQNLAWGGSGSVGLSQHVEHALLNTYPQSTRFLKKKRHELRKDLVDLIAKTIRPVLGNVLQLPNVPLPTLGILIVAWATDGPMILEISQNLSDQDHGQHGYSAIGSGDIFPYFAMTSIAHYGIAERSLAEAKMIAYRIVDDAIKVAAYGLGPPIQMIEVVKSDSEVTAHELSSADLEILRDKVQEWKEVEAEDLTKLVGVAPASPDPATSVPQAVEAEEG